MRSFKVLLDETVKTTFTCQLKGYWEAHAFSVFAETCLRMPVDHGINLVQFYLSAAVCLTLSSRFWSIFPEASQYYTM